MRILEIWNVDESCSPNLILGNENLLNFKWCTKKFHISYHTIEGFLNHDIYFWGCLGLNCPKLVLLLDHKKVRLKTMLRIQDCSVCKLNVSAATFYFLFSFLYRCVHLEQSSCWFYHMKSFQNCTGSPICFILHF